MTCNSLQYVARQCRSAPCSAVRVSVRPSVCPTVCLRVYLHVCIELTLIFAHLLSYTCVRAETKLDADISFQLSLWNSSVKDMCTLFRC